MTETKHPTVMEIVESYLNVTEYSLDLDEILELLPTGRYPLKSYQKYLQKQKKKIYHYLWKKLKPKNPFLQELLLIHFNQNIDWEKITEEQLFKRRNHARP